MCTYRLVLLPTIGSSQLLRLQLQMKMRQIKADDKVLQIGLAYCAALFVAFVHLIPNSGKCEQYVQSLNKQ